MAHPVQESTTAVIVQKLSGPVAIGTGGGTFLFGMNVSEIVAVGGLLIAFATFVVNWYYKYKEDKRRRLR